MSKEETDEVLTEYDFSVAEQGKYSKHFEHGVTAVLLDEDVAKVFSDTKHVNDTLRALTPTAVIVLRTSLGTGIPPSTSDPILQISPNFSLMY